MKKLNFTENEIRPKDLLGKEHDIAVIQDLGRILTRYKEFVMVSCPACGSDNYIKKYIKDSFNYVECVECETMYINPRPSPELLEWCYQESESHRYWNKYVYPSTENVRRKKLMVPRVDRLISILSKYNHNANALLEVGAGFGSFCAELITRNIFRKVVAIELNHDYANSCREKGIEIIEMPIELIDHDKTGYFDVIVSFETIEHLFSAKDFIMQCSKMLKPDGFLILTCPNGKGFDFTVLKEKCNSMNYWHLNYFNTNSIRILLKGCDFNILDVSTPGKLDVELVKNKYDSGEYDITNDAFLSEILVNRWDSLRDPFQEFIAENGLSSSMWVVARKL